MAKYRKKPVVIEAERWFKNGDHSEDDCYIVRNPNGSRFLSEGEIVRYYRNPSVKGDYHCTHCNHIMNEHGWIDTLEGGHIVCPGDWVIKGVKGEFYPCKPDIFDATYESA